MSGYGFFCNSNAFGIILIGHDICLDCWDGLKQMKKYPGYCELMQKAYMDRLGFASIYALSHCSKRKLV